METGTAQWVALVELDDIPVGGGVACLTDDGQIALLRPDPDHVFAIDNHCSHWNEAVLSRGLLRGGNEPAVACPLHKRLFSLRTGRCLGGDCAALRTWPVRIEDGRVYVDLMACRDAA